MRHGTSMPNQIGSKPRVATTGKKIGTKIKRSPWYEMKKPPMKRINIIVNKTNHFPKGRLINMVLISSPPPKNRKTELKMPAPMMINKTMVVTISVL